MTVELVVDGRTVVVHDETASLLDTLRDELGKHAVKDGCSPQGQCGCCTVLVDGAPRVSCVTPTRRVAGRHITTLDGLEAGSRAAWAEAFSECGASQCGFCTPGIVVRLEGLRASGRSVEQEQVDRALAAHLCRCTGWHTIEEAYRVRTGVAAPSPVMRDLGAAAQRATLEGHAPQSVGPEVAVGGAPFADDTAPADALVAVLGADGEWVVAETVAAARAAASKVQGRRTTEPARPPLALPEGDWRITLRTSWVEPAYLETDASWCAPGGEPSDPLANGGAFGGKVASPLPGVARSLADRHGRAVRVLWSREDSVRAGPKRPPLAAGLRADGSGVVRVVRTDGIADAIRSVLPGVTVEEVDVAGPPTSARLRAAGWAEAAVLAGVLAAPDPATPIEVRSPAGAVATASIGADGGIDVGVRCGVVLDPIVLRSYVMGAAHMAAGWVTSEGLAVAEDGEVLDLTVRSFGVLRASDTPPVRVHLEDDDGEAVNGSDAAFAAVAAAVWRHQGLPQDWPTRRPVAAGSVPSS